MDVEMRAYLEIDRNRRQKGGEMTLPAWLRVLDGDRMRSIVLEKLY
jgi:hypothetical protein